MVAIDFTEAVVIAPLSATISAIGAYFAYRAAMNSKTRNGHTLGEQVDDIREDVSAIRMWMVEHLRDHANRSSSEER